MPQVGDKVQLTVTKTRVFNKGTGQWFGFGRVDGISGRVLFHRDQFACERTDQASETFLLIVKDDRLEGYLDAQSKGWRLKGITKAAHE